MAAAALAADRPARRGRLHPRPALRRRPRRPAGQGAAARRGPRRPTTAPPTSARCSAATSRAMIVEALGTFLLVLVICAVAFNPRARQEWAPLAIGTTLGFAVMVFGPLTGGSFNPARWFGPALVGDDVRRHLALPARPARRRAAGGGGLPLRDRGRAVAAGPEPPTSARDAGRERRRRAETELRQTQARPRPKQSAPSVRVAWVAMRRVTFSRNYTLSLSRTCQCYCKYCAFATHRAHIYAPEEVERAPRRGGAAQRQGAARPHRRAPRGQPRGRRAAALLGARRLHLLRGLGLRAGARARPAARTPTSACSRARTWPGCAR